MKQKMKIKKLVPCNDTVSKLKNRSGFSLIELVFAMFFLIIIVFGVVSLQSSNLGMINRQNKEIQAHFYANQSIEIVSVLSGTIGNSGDYIINPTGNGYALMPLNPNPPNNPRGSTIQPDNFFYRKVTVDDSISPAYKITSTITWEDTTGEHTVDVKRIIQ